jgi:hypothetical protein
MTVTFAEAFVRMPRLLMYAYRVPRALAKCMHGCPERL